MRETLNKPIPIGRLILVLVGAGCFGVGLGFSIKALGRTVYIPFFPNVLDFAVVMLAGLLLIYLATKQLMNGEVKKDG